jgi:competence protein ComEA
MRMLLATLFLTFAAISPAWAGVDINGAPASELESLPGIGPSKAAAIVQYRTDHGAFTSVDDLDNVPGIGPSTLASLRDQVTVGKGAKGAAAAPAAPAPVVSPSGTASAPAAPTASTTASTSSAGGCPININTADATALEDLPGIGASKAAAILQHRVDSGPYASCDALDDVSGIGPSTVAGLRDCCRVK